MKVVPHELAYHLRGGFILRPANREKPLAQFALDPYLDPYAETNILHRDRSVPNGYTFD